MYKKRNDYQITTGKRIPDYLTRYYQKDEYPFLSLNDLPLEEANEIKRRHCIKNGIGRFYAQDDYLVHRREIEEWIYGELMRLGGKPDNDVPVYMTLGDSPKGEYDIRAELQKNAEAIRIPCQGIDMSVVTFTYPDSMYEFIRDGDGKVIYGRRTNTPKVYMYDQLPALIQEFQVYDDYKFNIEAQVWNREMLHQYWIKIKESRNDHK